MGSSTAIVVALARCFLGKDCKDEALAIEDVINQGHSGIDFAAIWEERPIVIQRNRYEFIDLPKGLQQRLSRGHRSSYCADIYNHTATQGTRAKRKDSYGLCRNNR